MRPDLLEPRRTEGTPVAPGVEDVRRADLAFAATVVVAFVAIAALYSAFPTIVATLLLAALLSYTVLPLVDRLDARMPLRWLAVLVIAFGGVGLLALAFVLLAPTLARDIARIPEVLAGAGEFIADAWADAAAFLPRFVRRFVEATVASTTAAVASRRPDPETLTNWASSAASGVTALASAVIFLPIFVLLMLRRYHSFVHRVAGMVPPRWQPQYFARVHQADHALSGFVRGQALVALLLAVAYSAAFTAVGIPLGLILGILAGVGELVPFLGGAIAVVFGTLLALAGGDSSDVLWVLGTYFALQGFEGAFLTPHIVGTKARLRPIAVILALAIGAKLFGMIGLLLSVPATTVLMVGKRAAIDAYKLSPFFRRHAPA